MTSGNGGNGSRWFRVADEPRDWEDFYRERWSYDRSVRTSHGVNCSGSCSWEVFVKDGLICWELQKTDWPQIDSETPNYEPRGCQRGISASWYPYSPVRPKYPYVRGVLLEFYRAERASGRGPVEAWAAIVEDPERTRAYREARGKAGRQCREAAAGRQARRAEQEACGDKGERLGRDHQRMQQGLADYGCGHASQRGFRTQNPL